MLAVAATACVLSLSFARTDRERAESLLRSAFGDRATISSVTIMLTANEKDSLRLRTRGGFAEDAFEVLSAFNGNTIVGYAVVDNVRGKDQPITYCVVVDSQFVVKSVEILVYREPYGGEVRSTRWLSQFEGKQLSDELRSGREIKIITGATISSRSVTSGVQRTLSLLHIVKSRLPHQPGSSK